MQKVFAGIVVLMVIFCGLGQAVAEPNSQPGVATDSGKPALTPDQARQVRDLLREITEVVSDPKAAAAKTEAAAKEAPKKNMAEVADKALSLLSGYIGVVASVMTKVAPEVWRVMVRQQYANAIAGPLVPFALLGFVTIFVVVTKRWWGEPELIEPANQEQKDSYNANWLGRFWVTSLIPGVLYFVFGIWASVKLSSSVQMFINPEYYAFRDLVQILLNRGGL